MSIPAGLETLFAIEPPELGPGPRSDVLPEGKVNRKLEESLAGLKLRPERQNLIRALALLWHDHLDAAHVIAQDIESPDGSFIHGIVHRREPDYSNAKYWFRRVGAHPAYPEIARRTRDLLKARNAESADKNLLQNPVWNALGFVNFCERAATKPGSEDESIAREIQRIEAKVLLDYLAG